MVGPLSRVNVEWSGIAGMPGLSTFYFSETTVSYPLFVNLWSVIKGYFPTGITWTIPTGGDKIDTLTGELVGSWGTAGANVIACTGTGNFSAPTGILVKWDTGTISDGHRTKGKTFLVPVLASKFTSGIVDPAFLTTINTQLTNYLTSQAGAQQVWHRPKFERVGTGPRTMVRDGGQSTVNSVSVSPKAVVLRSRRD